MLNNHLTLLCDAKKLDEALILGEELLHNAEYLGRAPEDATLNSDPFVALCCNNLGEILRKMGRFVAAETNFQRAIAIQERVSGKDTGHCQDVRYNLGKLWKAQGTHISELEQLETELGKEIVVD